MRGLIVSGSVGRRFLALAAALLGLLLLPCASAAAAPCAPGVGETTREKTALMRAENMRGDVSAPLGGLLLSESQTFPTRDRDPKGRKQLHSASGACRANRKPSCPGSRRARPGLGALRSLGQGVGSLGGGWEWLVMYSNATQPGYIFSEELDLWAKVGEGGDTTLWVVGHVFGSPKTACCPC